MNPKVKPNWPAILELYRKSGLSQADFCRSQKISRSSFSYHAKLHDSDSSGPTSQRSLSPFVSVREKQEFKLKINESLVLSFDTLPDATWLSSFVKSLGGEHAGTWWIHQDLPLPTFHWLSKRHRWTVWHYSGADEAWPLWEVPLCLLLFKKVQNKDPILGRFRIFPPLQKARDGKVLLAPASGRGIILYRTREAQALSHGTGSVAETS